MSTTIYHDIRVVQVPSACIDDSVDHFGLMVLVGNSRGTTRRWEMEYFAPEATLTAYAVATSYYFRNGSAAWKTHRTNSAFDPGKWIARVRKAIAEAEEISVPFLDRTIASSGPLLLEGRRAFQDKTIREALKAARDFSRADTGQPSRDFLSVHGPNEVN